MVVLQLEFVLMLRVTLNIFVRALGLEQEILLRVPYIVILPLGIILLLQ